MHVGNYFSLFQEFMFIINNHHWYGCNECDLNDLLLYNCGSKSIVRRHVIHLTRSEYHFKQLYDMKRSKLEIFFYQGHNDEPK